MPCQQDTPSPWRPLTSYHGNEKTSWGEWKSWHTARKNRLKNRNRLSSEWLERQGKAARGVERRKSAGPLWGDTQGDLHHAQNLQGVTSPASHSQLTDSSFHPYSISPPRPFLQHPWGTSFPWQECITVLEHHQLLTFLSCTSHVELRHSSYSRSQTFVQCTIYVWVLIGEQVNTQAESVPGRVPGGRE